MAERTVARRPVPLRRVREIASAQELAWARVREDIEAHIGVLALGLALILGASVRLSFTLYSDFPLNDGGLFYTMVRDIQAHNYALPAYTSYNGGSIPFAYPFLPFYSAAALDDIGPWSLLDVFRFLPLITSMLTIVALYLLSRRLFVSPAVVGLTVIFFALAPRSYKWLIMGGGLTRSMGLLFAVLALHQVLLLYQTRKRRYIFGTAILAGMTVLSHPEASWVLAFSAVLLWGCYGRDRASAINSLLVAGGVLAITAPWWGTVVAQHGFTPLFSASQEGWYSWETWRNFYYWSFTEQPYLNVSAVLAILGALVLLAQGKPFVPLWLIAIVVLEPRSAPTFAALPVAMLTATAVVSFAVPIWKMTASRTASPQTNGAAHHDGSSIWPARRAELLPKIGVLLVAAYLATILVQSAFYPTGLLYGLGGQERDAMAWVKENTDENDTFLVVTGDTNWATDRTSEWFPALTGRTSLGTFQGYEWLGRKKSEEQAERALRLQQCAYSDSFCIEHWARSGDVTFSYVYLAERCCPTLERSLFSANDYRLVRNSSGAVIFAHR
ncbi:MAG: hypothetical protein WEB04_04120 [Dehalococcoidia bacterium]